MISPSDTIIVNDSVLAGFQQSRGYNYASELTQDGSVNYFDRLWRYLEDLFDLPSEIGRDLPVWGWWALAALVLAGVFYLVWTYRVRLFGPRDRNLEAQEITVDDINEVDIDQLIAEAEQNGDHLALCRLRYLKILKAASDASLVRWRRHKTPTQYAMEWRDDDFGVMTNHFLRIRYGHYTADAALADKMRTLQETLQVRIKDTTNTSRQAQSPSDNQQEGGDQA